MKHVNTSEMTRVWTSLQGPDGRTLQLAPGETVDLPKTVHDAHLKPVEPAHKTKRGHTSEPAKGDPEPKAGGDAEKE